MAPTCAVPGLLFRWLRFSIRFGYLGSGGLRCMIMELRAGITAGNWLAPLRGLATSEYSPEESLLSGLAGRGVDVT